MMWTMIMIVVLAAVAAGVVYMISRFCKMPVIQKMEKKGYRILCGIGILVLFLLITGFTMGSINAIVCLIHLVVIWLLCDFVAWILKKAGRQICYTVVGIMAVVVTILYLSVGFYQAHHVWRTYYAIDTDKDVGKLRIVQFADSHVGTTFHADGFAKHMKEIEKEKPDVVLITGDFVDDDTSKEDMIACCKALGQLKTTYGIYFAFGNHDEGYYEASYRGYSGEDVVKELEKNHVTVLEDKSVCIDDRFYVVGRMDKSVEERGGERTDIQELVKPLDDDKFIIDMNHQPNDYEAEADAQVDLVLSGHTHGGQFFPIIHVGEWIGANDRTYGYEKREKTNFIVTSGISDWAVKFKTGCRSEYVVIDIQ